MSWCTDFKFRVTHSWDTVEKRDKQQLRVSPLKSSKWRMAESHVPHSVRAPPSFSFAGTVMSGVV